MNEQIETFIAFSEKINDYLCALMVTNEIKYDQYHFSKSWPILCNDHVSIRPFPFSGIANQRISGLIVQDQHEITIGYNQNMPEKRKNFTISHELTHYLYHLNEENTIFTDTKTNLTYSGNDVLQEFQANIGASAILIPDIVLFRLMKENWSLRQLSDHFGISESALYIRLIQTMQAYFGVSFVAAKTNADQIRFKFQHKGKKASVTLGKNLEEKVLSCNRFIEAL